jgi:hypothetical protein
VPESVPVEVRIAGTDAEAEQIMGLVRRAEQGDATVVLELRKVLDQQPRLWRAAGDEGGVVPQLAHTTESLWLHRIAGDNPFFRESIARQTRALRRELLGEAPAPLEKLLVDRIVCTWLGVQYAEAHHARTMREQTFDQGAYDQERILRYQKLHPAAVKALAQLRRLPRPVVRVNVAERQVNVAGTAPGRAPAAPQGRAT